MENEKPLTSPTPSGTSATTLPWQLPDLSDLGSSSRETIGAERPSHMLPLRVELGRVVVPRTRLASFQPGAVVVLDSANEQEVDVVVGDQLIANGELVIHDGKVCVRITQFTIPNEQEPLRRAS